MSSRTIGYPRLDARYEVSDRDGFRLGAEWAPQDPMRLGSCGTDVSFDEGLDAYTESLSRHAQPLDPGSWCDDETPDVLAEHAITEHS